MNIESIRRQLAKLTEQLPPEPQPGPPLKASVCLHLMTDAERERCEQFSDEIAAKYPRRRTRYPFGFDRFSDGDLQELSHWTHLHHALVEDGLVAATVADIRKEYAL